MFEFLDMDLKKHMDDFRPPSPVARLSEGDEGFYPGLPPELVKVVTMSIPTQKNVLQE